MMAVWVTAETPSCEAGGRENPDDEETKMERRFPWEGPGTPLGMRDFAYIETRLLAPCVEATEAHGRLKQAGDTKNADRLMAAMQEFASACRDIRRDLRPA